MSERDAIEELSDLFVFLADNDFAGYSPLYEQIARAVATDQVLLEFIASAANPNARRGRIPILFFAATHDRVLANPESPLAAIYRGESQADPMPLLRDLLERDSAEVRNNMRTRSVQTNEVGRSAILSVAFGRAQRDVSARPVLFEIGPSAGLNLYLEHFHIDFTRTGNLVVASGPDNATVRLACELRGPITPPFPTEVFAPISRRGLDPNPIDVMNDSECRWLQACLWPGIPDRPERLAAAINVARLSPPHLLAGDAITDLSSALAPFAAEDHLLVFSTWVLAYIGANGRNAVVETIDRLGAKRDLDFITFEEPRFTPWVTDFDPSVFGQYEGEGTPTLLGLRSWRGGNCTTTALAVAHPHGRWIHWLEENHG
ncbi:MAG: DUF2332 domain-containing protein [Actinobacteria bacterium]|nr:DUF2332 domain-containing protein [Actinomycetota bacterium]